jgi:SsrA-binding protein
MIPLFQFWSKGFLIVYHIIAQGLNLSDKVACTNKKAYHDYTIDSTIEVGIMLTGAEVKSLRAGKANLRDGYAKIQGEEIFLMNVHISPYVYANLQAPDPLRQRKLLLHKREIRKLIGKVQEKGFALVPVKIYFNDKGKAKLALGLAKGKKLYDKRAALKKKQTDRETQREVSKYKRV